MLPSLLCWVRFLCPVLQLPAGTHSPNTDQKRLRSPLPVLSPMVGIRVC
jgi:hypothetical protein